MVGRRAASLLLVAMMLLTTSMAGCLGGGVNAFTEDDLEAPLPLLVPPVEVQIPMPPTLLGTTSIDYILQWRITDAYCEYGGVVMVEVMNKPGSNPMYVYGVGLQWEDSGEVIFKDTSVTVAPEESADLGVLAFAAPSEPGEYEYRILINVSAWVPSWEAWKDRGTIYTANTVTIDVHERINGTDPVVHVNDADYYERVNELIDSDGVEDVIDVILADMPGDYSVPHIAMAYDWVRDNIEYVADNGGDRWQSAGETLELGTGDCEDQAIIIASIVTGLGGNARVNIIEGHAFTTVWVGNAEALDPVNASLCAYYGTVLHISYLVDEMGYWLVIDTTAMGYAGGITPSSAPSVAGGSTWAFEDTEWLYTVDITGETGGGWRIFDI